MKKILLLISKGSELLEISPFTDVFGWNNVVGSKDIEVITASFHSQIHATWNLTIIPEINLSQQTPDLSEFDAIVIPGGFGYRDFFHDMKLLKFKHIIQHFMENNKIIVGVCTGVIALGEAGAIKDRKATTYLYDNDRYFRQLFSYGAFPVRKNIVIDENIITVSGPKNSLDAAFLLLERLSSKENAQIVKFNMCF